MKAQPLPLVRIVRRDETIIISFTVPVIDQRNFAAIVDELEVVARRPTPQYVIIDLTGLQRVDELGLTALQALRESIKEVGGTTTLQGPTDQMERAVSATRLATNIHDRKVSQRPPQSTRW